MRAHSEGRHGPSRVGRRFALRLGAALVALASVLIGVAVWSLGQSAEHTRRSQTTDQLTVGLSAALVAIDTTMRELDARADRFASGRGFQEALARGDEALLRRLATAEPGISLSFRGRSLVRPARGLRLRREVVLRRDGRTVGRVVASVPVDRKLYQRIRAATPLAQSDRLFVVSGGRVVLGGRKGAWLRPAGNGETAVADVRYLTRAATPRGSTIRLVAASPTASIATDVGTFRSRLFIAGFGSLAVLVALAFMLGGPILRALGDLTRVARAAELDALTGIANRGSFDARLEVELKRAEAAGTPLSLILLDIDRFKSINDTYGHPAGDEVLRRVGVLLQDKLRQDDFGARYGGEEFALLLPGTTGMGAMSLAERLRTAISELRVALVDEELRPTASFGVACTAEHPASDLVAAADAALYEAKRSGRNRSVLSAPIPL